MYTIHMTPQEAFDKVCRHLATQKRQAVDSQGQCTLRTEDGLSCAIGALIPDVVYDPDREEDICYLLESRELETNLDTYFLSGLQYAHDNTSGAVQLRQELYEIAHAYSLDSSAVALITEWSAEV